MTIPQPGSIWRKGECDERYIADIEGGWIYFSARGFLDTYRILADDWREWSRDAVQVWPQPETVPVGETVTIRRDYTYSPSGDPAVGVFDMAGQSGGWWEDEITIPLKIVIPLPTIPTVTATVEQPQ